MEVILILATLLGGGAALWYFWEKWSERTVPEVDSSPEVHRRLRSEPTKQNIERAILESDSSADWNSGGDDNRSILTYNHDVNLRFEILYTEEGTQRADFKDTWANCHPDPSATGYWCNLFYGTTLVERFILVSVDGGRAMLPVPKTGPKGQRPNVVLRLDYKVAQIHDALQTLDEYLVRSGLDVES